MGYTHYWYRKPEIPDADFARFIEDARHIVAEAGKRGIRLGDAFGEGEPQINAQCVALNGAGDEGCETFYYPIAQSKQDWEPDSPRVFDFCKTGQEPYDAVVVALLLAARETTDANLASDGTAAEWMEGMDLYVAATGKAPPSAKRLEAHFAKTGEGD